MIVRSPSMRGVGMFVWYVDEADGGSPGAIAARARETGLRYVLVKCGDGASPWAQFSTGLVGALQQDGLEVYGWAYCYGDDVDGELGVAEGCFAAGADGYVADVEAEYEGKAEAAEAFATGLVALCPPRRLLAYSPLPVIDQHQGLPYAQMNHVCDVVLPQFYSRALGDGWTPDRLWEQWDRWSTRWRAWTVPVPRIVPVGEAFGAATGDDVRALAAANRGRGAADAAFWEWGRARAEHWAAIAELALGRLA
jgi:hypothetical protein